MASVKKTATRGVASYERFACAVSGMKPIGTALKGDSGALTATRSKNCEASAGSLKSGVGAKILQFSNGANTTIGGRNLKKVYRFPVTAEGGETANEYALIDYRDFCWVQQENGSYLGVSGLPVEAGALAGRCDENGVTEIYFAGESGVYAFGFDREATLVREGGTALCGCFFHDRYFVALPPQTVAYSKPVETDDFTPDADGAGSVGFFDELGEILDILPFDGCVCIVKRRGIMKFFALGAAREFTVESKRCGCEDILKNSAAVCGKYLCFTALDGVYRVDGERAEKIVDGLPTERVSDEFLFAADGRRYYLSFAAADGQRTVAIDTETGACAEIFSLAALSPSLGGAIGVNGNHIYEYCDGGELPDGETSEFFADGIFIGDGKEKTLTGVRVYGEGGVEIVLSGGRGEASATVVTDGGVGTAKIAAKGKRFSVLLRLFKESVIERLEFEYQYAGVRV